MAVDHGMLRHPARYLRPRPDLDPAAIVPVGLDAVRTRLQELIAVGASKFVVVPVEEPSDWAGELTSVMDALGDLQN